METVDDRRDVVAKACRMLTEGDDPVGEIAARLGWSQRHLQRLFRETTGVAMSAYRRQARADRARSELRNGAPVTAALFAAGYGSARAFYEHGAPRLGMAPAQYADGGRGATVRFTTFATPIGIVLAAVTDLGLCAVHIGDDAHDLVGELRSELPGAALVDPDDDEDLRRVVDVLAALADGRAAEAVALPLDVKGTAFQAEVWEAIRRIPVGQTMTYADLAEAIGRPSSVRAVANAVGANRVALAIPCHRVVRTDGSGGGYRWGQARKQALLAAEAAPQCR